MNEEAARNILGTSIAYDGGLQPGFAGYVSWIPGDEYMTLDDNYTVDDIEAIAWWIRNKSTPTETNAISDQAPSPE